MVMILLLEGIFGPDLADPPPPPFTLVWTVKDFAMQAKKTSSIPESCGSNGSSWLHETDFMKSTGGNLFTFSNDAKEEGAISGKTLLKSAVTCLCTLADPV